MSRTLYEEAVSDANEVRKLAEEVAKEKVLEAITPRIKKLIEQRILGEADLLDDVVTDKDLDADENLSGLDDENYEDESMEFDDSTLDDVSATDDVDYLGMSEPKSAGLFCPMHGGEVDTSSCKNCISISTKGGTKIDIAIAEAINKMMTEAEAKDTWIIYGPMGGIVLWKGKATSASDAKKRAIDKGKKADQMIDIKKMTPKDKVNELKKQALAFRKLLESPKTKKLSFSQRKNVNKALTKMIEEAINLRKSCILTKHSGNKVLRENLEKTIKEIRKMATSKRNILKFLFEEEDKVPAGKQDMGKKKLPEAELVLSDEEQEGLVNAEEDDLSGVLADLFGDLQVSAGAEDEGGEEDMTSDEDLDDDDEDADAGGDMDFSDEGGDEGSDEEEVDLGEADDKDEEVVDEVYEIDEASIRNELRKMKRMRESAVDGAKSFGGGDAKEEVLDVDEDTFLNVLSDELGSVKESRRRQAARRPAPRAAPSRQAVFEAMSRKNREIASQGKQIETMKTQLTEMNLFNAKLLYANKLMQNKDLTVKQQRAIVEALDNAKTLREAKLLYRSLSESLSKRGKGALSENTNRSAGSASRSTPSAQPASTNGGETDRWAVMAGIK